MWVTRHAAACHAGFGGGRPEQASLQPRRSSRVLRQYVCRPRSRPRRRAKPYRHLAENWPKILRDQLERSWDPIFDLVTWNNEKALPTGDYLQAPHRRRVQGQSEFLVGSMVESLEG
jgi:hypothetical protein